MPAKKANKSGSKSTPSKSPAPKSKTPKSRSAKRQSAKEASAKASRTKSSSDKKSGAKKSSATSAAVNVKVSKAKFNPKSGRPGATKAAQAPAKKKVTHEARANKPAPATTVQASGRTKAPPAARADVPQSEAEKFAIEAARSLHDDKCTEIVVLDVRGKNPMTDFLVVASGTSDRQMRSVLHHVQELGEQLGYAAVRHTSDDRATWLLADFMNVIVHLFEPNTRAHYDIEMMWGDAPRLEWERPGSIRDRAGLNAGESN